MCACFLVRANTETSVDYYCCYIAHIRPGLAVITEPLESLGDSITTAVLLSWNKKPGDAIAEDDVIAVVETDKVCATKHSDSFSG